jgi:dihydroxyacid dehydratase/phosphogluconate dehydratase
MKEKETTRVQIELPEASMERLKALKEKTEATSYAEVTKNAFKLYERMIELAESGSVLLVRDKKGNTKELELFF